MWLLGIDGVLNVGASAWGDELQVGIAVMDGVRFKFRWSPMMIQRVAEIHNSGKVEIRWCSTWCEDIRSPAALLDLRDIRVSFEGPVRNVKMSKFTEAASVLVHESRPLIWTDDDIDWIVSTSSPNGSMPPSGVPSLLIQPSAREGLTPEHVRLVQEFVDAQSS